MGSRFKSRTVTDPLVRRSQLQHVVNQIGGHVANGFQMLEEKHEARLARIEAALNLPPIDAKPELVTDEVPA